MLRIRLDTEDWRHECSALIDEAVDRAGVTRDHVDQTDLTWFDDVVNEVSEAVLQRLNDDDVKWRRVYTQSVGTWVLVQGATERDNEAYLDAFSYVTRQPEIVQAFEEAAEGLQEYHSDR